MNRRFFAASMLSAIVALSGCQTIQKQRGDVDEPVGHPISVADLPPKVRAGFDAAYPSAAIKAVYREAYPDGALHFRIEFFSREGLKSTVEFDEDGQALPEH